MYLQPSPRVIIQHGSFTQKYEHNIISRWFFIYFIIFFQISDSVVLELERLCADAWKSERNKACDCVPVSLWQRGKIKRERRLFIYNFLCESRVERMWVWKRASAFACVRQIAKRAFRIFLKDCHRVRACVTAGRITVCVCVTCLCARGWLWETQRGSVHAWFSCALRDTWRYACFSGFGGLCT